jgi:hypothetical protein
VPIISPAAGLCSALLRSLAIAWCLCAVAQVGEAELVPLLLLLVLQEGAIALELSMLDRPEHSQEFEKVWGKPKSTWGQALPHKFTGGVQ